MARIDETTLLKALIRGGYDRATALQIITERRRGLTAYNTARRETAAIMMGAMIAIHSRQPTALSPEDLAESAVTYTDLLLTQLRKPTDEG